MVIHTRLAPSEPSGHWGLSCGPQPHLREALGRRTGPAPRGCLSEGVYMFT